MPRSLYCLMWDLIRQGRLSCLHLVQGRATILFIFLRDRFNPLPEVVPPVWQSWPHDSARDPRLCRDLIIWHLPRCPSRSRPSSSWKCQRLHPKHCRSSFFDTGSLFSFWLSVCVCVSVCLSVCLSLIFRCLRRSWSLSDATPQLTLALPQVQVWAQLKDQPLGFACPAGPC